MCSHDARWVPCSCSSKWFWRCRITSASSGPLASGACQYTSACGLRRPLMHNVMWQPRGSLGLCSRKRRCSRGGRRYQTDRAARLCPSRNGRMLAGTEKLSPSLGKCRELGRSSVSGLVEWSQVVHQAASVRIAYRCRRAKAWRRNASWVASCRSVRACYRWWCAA